MALLLVVCFFWAISFVATKVALALVPPLTVVFFRLVISSICFWVWFRWQKRSIRWQGWKWLGHLFWLSLLGTGLHYGSQTIGLGLTKAVNASLYAATGPISITIIAVIYLKERITLKKALGIGLALIGVLGVMGTGTLKSFELKGQIVGDIMVFLSIFMWALFTVFGKEMTRKMGALDMTAIVTYLGALYMLPTAIGEWILKPFSPWQIPVKAWLAIAFLGVTCSFLATLLYFKALEKMESQKVGVFLYTIPPMTYIFSAIYLGESIGWNLVVGSFIVLLGVYLTERDKGNSGKTIN